LAGAGGDIWAAAADAASMGRNSLRRIGFKYIAQRGREAAGVQWN
jgi:hypothetical protein